MGIVISQGAALSQTTQPKLYPTRGKGRRKGKEYAEQHPTEDSSNIMGIHDTHLNS